MKKLLAGLGVVATLGIAGYALAQTYPLPQVSLGFNDLVQVIPNGQPRAGNQYIAESLLANFSGTPRNYLDNGTLNVQQRGTGIVTCGTTASAVYGADRWACQANVTSGAGRSSLVTTAALLPVGFATVNELYRVSGALTQPICAIQEIPGKESVALAGQTVTLSVYEAALGALAADNGNVTTLSIIYGTGTDEGIQTPTASPAITPAWTGIGFVVNQKPITISTVPTRYSVTGTVPISATEVGVEICFTPVVDQHGVTDGFAWTGAQLEVAPAPSAYEFHTTASDLAKAQRYFYEIIDNASAQVSVASCAMSTTSIANCLVPFPVPMRIVPTMTYATGFAASASTASSSATACTGLTTSTTLSGQTASINNVIMDCASTTGFGAAGTAGFLWTLGSATTGTIKASAEF